MNLFRRKDDKVVVSNQPGGVGGTDEKEVDVTGDEGKLKRAAPRPWDNPYAQAKLLEERNEWLTKRHRVDIYVIVALVIYGVTATILALAGEQIAQSIQGL